MKVLNALCMLILSLVLSLKFSDGRSKYSILFPTKYKSQKIQLEQPLLYNRRSIKEIWIYANGYVSLGEPVTDKFYQDYPTFSQNVDPPGLLSHKLISVFAASVQSGYVGVENITNMDELTCKENLQKRRLEGNIRMVFPGASRFSSTGIVIVNWRDLGNGVQNLKNNFELVILYNERLSFAVFHYSLIAWLYSGSQLSKFARTEIIAGDGYQISTTPRSSLEDWNELTNIGLPGEWIVQISNPASRTAFYSPILTKSQLTVIQQRSEAFLLQMRRQCQQTPVMRPKVVVDRNNPVFSSARFYQQTCRDISCSQPSSECRQLGQGSCCVCADGYHGNGSVCISLDESKTIAIKGSLVLLSQNRILVSQELMLSAVQSRNKMTGYTSFTNKTIPEHLSYTILLLVPFFDICNGFFAKPISSGIHTPQSLYTLTGGAYTLRLNFSIESVGEFQLMQKSFGFEGPNFNRGNWETSIQIIRMENYTEELYEIDTNGMEDPIHFSYEVIGREDKISFPEKIVTLKSKQGFRKKSLRWSGEIDFSGNCFTRTLTRQKYFVKLSRRKYCTGQCDNQLCKPFCLALPTVTDIKPDFCQGVKCGINEKCKSTDIDYKCECKEGFNKDENSLCRKIEREECDGRICPIGAKCLPVTPQKRECQCLMGYSLQNERCIKDSRVCGANLCQLNSECIMIGGEDMCVCKSGYILLLENGTCTKENSSLCSSPCKENEQCSKLINDYNYQCNCKPGYRRVNERCQLDECGRCPRNAVCVGQRCRCRKNFFEQSGACMWNCALCNLTTTTCTQDGCQCRSGYMPDGITPNTCIKEVPCISAIDCRKYEICDRGRCVCLLRNNVTGECQSLYGPEGPCSVCGENSDCIPLSGMSVKCYCRPGFEPGDAPNTCIPSKCSCQDRPNPKHWHCVNGVCRCKPGLKLLGGHCTECSSSDSEADTARCHINALCVYNTENNFYHCKCQSGYRGDGLKCLPDEECGVCPRNAQCVSGKCLCNRGFIVIDGICQWNCSQCDSWTSVCGYDSCECLPGFRAERDGIRCTPEVTCNRDIDCPTNEVCVNSRCHCGISRRNGKCMMNQKGCSQCGENTLCDPRTRLCFCRNGFTQLPGDGIFTCVKDCSKCSPRAYCDQRGCVCFSPYLGDGVYCELDNECDSSVHCGPNAFCGWYEDKRRCLCQRGYKYNRDTRSCTEIALIISTNPNGLLNVYQNEPFQIECLLSTEDKSPLSLAPQWRKIGAERLDFARVLAPTINRRILRVSSAQINMTGMYECFAGNYRSTVRVDVRSSKCGVKCGSNSICDEQLGQCTCLAGFFPIVPGVCVKKTCHYVPNMCSSNEVCIDSLCQCKFGFVRENGTCIMKSNCLTLKNCHRFADCQLLNQQYICQCRRGFIGDGINYCRTEPYDCRLSRRCVQNAICSLDSSNNYICTCKPGYYGDGSKVCTKLIDCNQNPHPCGPHSNCEHVTLLDTSYSQKLYNTGRCVCDLGYELVNDEQCVDMSLTRSTFLFAIGNAIIQQSIVQGPEDNVPKLFVADIRGVIPGIYAIATDCSDQTVYWSAGRGRRIMMKSAKYPNSTSKSFPFRDLRLVESMAVDWVSGNLFYIDQGWGHIAVTNRKSFKRIVLIKNAAGARRIALDPLNSRIYWSVTSLQNPSIWTANMDGSQKQMLIQLKFPPHGLTFDWKQRRLCWVSPSLQKNGPMLGRAFSLWGHQLTCWSVDSSRLVASVVSLPDQSLEGGLVYHSDKFYIGKRGKKMIVSMSNGLLEDIPIRHACCGSNINGFSILSSFCPTGYSNSCARSNSYGGCGHLCLPTGPQNSPKCCSRDLFNC